MDWLGNLCYNCGLFSHVTRRCTLDAPVRVVTFDRVSTWLYRDWLLVKLPNCLQFITPSTETNDHFPIPMTKGSISKENKLSNIVYVHEESTKVL